MAEHDSVVIAGAGLVGSLAAIYLTRRGSKVTVLERRGDMRKATVEAGRSINLAISERGLHALRQVGLEAEALRHAIPMRGRMMHPVHGELAFQAYGKDDSQHINSISRSLLNQILMTAAEKAGAEILFHRRVTDVRFGEDLEVEHEGRFERIAAPVLIGADGAGSAVRLAMMKRDGCAETQDVLGHGYKELTLPAGPGGSHRVEKHALHIWPRGAYMLIALPNQDGSFTCTLFLPFKGPVSFESLRAPADVERFFADQFPDALKLIPDVADQFFANPTGHMATLKCGPWNVDGNALLLGDAAHAIVPFFGQGMNCGFEDCVLLDGLLAEHAWPEAFETFSGARKTHADAIADMAVENFVEMRDRVGDAHFLLEKQVERALLNAFPGEFLSRYALVSFSRAPYRFAYRVGEIAWGIVEELARDLKRAEDLNLDAAGKLIRARLVPYLKDNEYGFRT